ncbi:MAG: YdjY domain-containing protein, partial [Candidatus Poribacteria bacterium]
SIYIHIDPADKIAELSEKNNIAIKEINIRPESAAPVSEESNEIKKIREGVYQIGRRPKYLILDVNKNEIIVPGRIRKTEGVVEYLATGELGKTHESVLILDVEPIHLQVALLRLGMEFGSNLRYQGDPIPPKGDPAEIWVEWEASKPRPGQTGKRALHRAEDLVYNVKKNAPMQHTNWVFTGARIIDNRIFTAQNTQSIIAIYRDADAIFNNPLPGGTDDTTYRVNSEVVPPEGTEVKLIIKPVKKVG